MKHYDCAIIANGGAGGIKFPRRRHQGLVKAVAAGYEILKQGGSSLDAVEKAAMILEDSKVFNAGTGSYLNLTGEVEMDASLMTSELKFGAVGAIKNVRYPIKVARLVMEKTDHLLLCGDGAASFAYKMGLKKYNPRTKEKIRLWKRKKKNIDHSYFPQLKKIAGLYGTIGVVAIDKTGLIAVANSTGGISLNLPGRLGDTPIIGGGIYADRFGGVTATGHGEEIMRHLLSFRAVSLMARYPAPLASKKIIDYATAHNCRCGLIGIDRKGRILNVHNTPAMSWCYIKKGRMKSFNY
ncbi:MAG TPA: asparaginase [candidate division WOR-3 bacterium]|uniref:Asparaginase n=1 Tax=candidate division WOR-3 bacterium TaxID=2052148 RepID=A0A9C9JZW0_UNCW3|nr:asparaginase [candidate division WOR-3 bacterium]